MLEELKPKSFTLEFREQSVEIVDPATALKLMFLLREFNGKGRDGYINTVAKMTKLVNGATEVKNFDGLQAELFSFDDNVLGANVTKNWVQGLPAHIVVELFNMCQDLCGLGDSAEADAKND